MIAFKDFIRDSYAKSKKKDGMIEETTSQLQFPTGFMYLDYICGNYIIPEDDNGPVCKYHNVGMLAGSVNMVIAKSQGGKSTLASELAILPYICHFHYTFSPAFSTTGMRYSVPFFNIS